jgi:hypothetical protein
MITIQNDRAFSADLDAFAKKLGLTRATVYRSTALELWNGITKRTPVDTGRARSSWNLSIGSPDPTIPPERGPGTGKNKNAKTPPTSPTAATPRFDKIDGSAVIYITSNLPYIEALENGHSKQAPVGMVMVSTAEVVARIQLIMEGMQE